jgi:DNA (cytosine-5)-methyltransferase 1
MVAIEDLIQVIFVFPIETIPDLHEWLDESPDHFFFRYIFPLMVVETWDDRQLVDCDEFEVCTTCCGEKIAHRKLLKTYLSHVKQHPLTVLDLFAGVGAFSLGMKEGFSGLKVTHAIEVSPSAARTFR